MYRFVPSGAPRMLAALALTLAFACPAASGAGAASAPPPKAKPVALPSGGPARAHAHPPAPPQSVEVPVAPPPPPALPPPIVVPTRAPEPPPPPTITPDAPDVTSHTAAGLRVTFGPERADLSPEANAAIMALARAAKPPSSFTITAFAAGGDDPSTPRRLSLSRALAVRSVLIHAGVASVDIYVKALGASMPAIKGGPADRVDIAVSEGPGPAQPALPGAPTAPKQAAPWGDRPAATPSAPASAPASNEKAAP